MVPAFARFRGDDRKKSKIGGNALVFPIAITRGFGAFGALQFARAVLGGFGSEPIVLSAARGGLGQRALRGWR